MVVNDFTINPAYLFYISITSFRRVNRPAIAGRPAKGNQLGRLFFAIKL